VGALYSAQVQLADAGNAQPSKARFPDNAHTSGQPGIRAGRWIPGHLVAGSQHGDSDPGEHE
jgi:hypothetical protein